MLEKVKVFQYLGRLLLQDDNDVQPLQSQLRKARGTWAQAGQVLRKENAPPQVSTTFYKAIMQSVLLYGSKTWVLSKAVLVWLKGFHIRAAYKMAKIHVPRRVAHQQWIYLPSDKVLKECGMHPIQHYIDVQWDTITTYVMNHIIFAECKEGNCDGNLH